MRQTRLVSTEPGPVERGRGGRMRRDAGREVESGPEGDVGCSTWRRVPSTSAPDVWAEARFFSFTCLNQGFSASPLLTFEAR